MRLALAIVAVFLASSLHAQERTLAWTSLDVRAMLEDDGTLRVAESHRMRFDGDWNGGSRTFRVRAGQQLSLIAVSEIGDNGEAHPLTAAPGQGIGLREYRFDGAVLRWRARNPTDPPFRNEERTYVIEYLLRNVIERNEEHYVLDHDFAFVDRPGPIESYSATLELGPLWQPVSNFQSRFERTNIPPGESVRLEVQLRWLGEGQPAFVAPLVAPEPDLSSRRPVPVRAVETPKPPMPIGWRLGALAAFCICAVLLTAMFLRDENWAGRFEPAPEVTPAWLEEHLLVHRAEVVGAAWDGGVGAGEVAALIAIMTAEGKIESVPGEQRLRLLVDRSQLSDYEQRFVDALFINGAEIDPHTLRQHYRHVGFDPSYPIRGPLRVAAQKLVGSPVTMPWAVGGIAFLLSAVVFPGMAIAFALTFVLAAMYRTGLKGQALARGIPLPMFVSAVAHASMNGSIAWLIANLVAGLVLLWIALRSALWHGTDVELRHLRDFLAAREFLRQWIARREPQVDPRWIPYMLAFGLVPDERWSVAPASAPQRREYEVEHDTAASPAEPQVASSFDTFTSSTAGNSSAPRDEGRASAPPFQPGGGSFGGAGATGSWASLQAFATTIAATVPHTPSRTSDASDSGWTSFPAGSDQDDSSSSSSSSSDSSSSSSSSSGGGGGGGW